MITVQSSSIAIAGKPRLAPTTLANALIDRMAVSLLATGEVVLTGHAGDIGTGWSVGFIQAMAIEQDWALYRGRAAAQGSTLVQLGRPPVLPTPGCWDASSASSPFYSPSDEPDFFGPSAIELPKNPRFPMKIQLAHFDSPTRSTILSILNQKTSAPNYLEETRTVFRFVTALAMRGPGASLQILRGFNWRCDWHAKLKWPDTGNAIAVLSRDEAIPPVVGTHFIGPPKDPVLLPILSRPQPTTCNEMVNPANQLTGARYQTDWAPFDTAS